MINKLLIIRKKHVSPTVLDDSGFKSVVKGEPIAVCPIAWKDEEGVSHWGYNLPAIKLKDLDKVREWVAQKGYATLLEVPEKKTIEDALASVGLRTNKSA